MCFPEPGWSGTTSLWKQKLPFHVMKKCLWHAGQMECEIGSGKEVPRDCGFKVQFQKECKLTSGFQTLWHSEERKDFNWSGFFPLITKSGQSHSASCSLIFFLIAHQEQALSTQTGGFLF